MATVGKGSIIKFTLILNGLADAEFQGFKIDFYAKEKKESRISAYYTAESTDSEKVKYNETDDNWSIIVDTEDLDTGTIGATLKVSYTDEATDKELTEILMLSSNVTLNNAPQSEEQVDAELEEEPSEEPSENEGE